MFNISADSNGSGRRNNNRNATQSGAPPSLRGSTIERSRSARNVLAAQASARSLRASTMERSGSARNVLGAPSRSSLPILERGSSQRNLRGLPDRCRNGSGTTQASALESLRSRGARRSNSTRRFFVADQHARNNGSISSTSAASASLGERLRRVNLERGDSTSSIGSMSMSIQPHSLLNNSLHTTNSNRFGSGSSQIFQDSTTSALTMESMSMSSRAPTSSLSRLSSSRMTAAASASASASLSAFLPDASASFSGDTDHDDMMSLFSKDSVRVRQHQLTSSGHSDGSGSGSGSGTSTNGAQRLAGRGNAALLRGGLEHAFQLNLEQHTARSSRADENMHAMAQQLQMNAAGGGNGLMTDSSASWISALPPNPSLVLEQQPQFGRAETLDEEMQSVASGNTNYSFDSRLPAALNLINAPLE